MARPPQSNNAQQEYYLTDIIAMAVQDGVEVVPIQASSEIEVTGVNDRIQLAQLERHAQKRLVEQLMLMGRALLIPPGLIFAVKSGSVKIVLLMPMYF